MREVMDQKIKNHSDTPPPVALLRRGNTLIFSLSHKHKNIGCCAALKIFNAALLPQKLNLFL